MRWEGRRKEGKRRGELRWEIEGGEEKRSVDRRKGPKREVLQMN